MFVTLAPSVPECLKLLVTDFTLDLVQLTFVEFPMLFIIV